MKSYHDYLEIALKTVRMASDYLVKNFGTVKKMTHKHDGHYGIEDDKVVNTLYETQLGNLTPEANLYTEEGQRDLSSGFTWIVDPIDGTSNYRVGIPFFNTQICLLENKEPVVSVIKAPLLSQEFTAIKGERFLNESLINVGKGTKQEDRLWYAETLGKVMPYVRTTRNFGSCGIELAYTASGKIDAVLNSGSQLYDYAPGVLLIREAGGRVVNKEGDNWKFDDSFLLASNKYLVSELQKII